MTKKDIKKLFSAIEKGDHSTALALLSYRKDSLEIVGFHNANCRDKTPLMYAMQCGDLVLSRELIGLGANVNAAMPVAPRFSVIQLAAKFGHGLNPKFKEWLSFISELLKLGANPSEALWPACQAYTMASDRPEVISLLLSSGASPDSMAGNTGNTVRELVQANCQTFSPTVLELFEIKPEPSKT